MPKSDLLVIPLPAGRTGTTGHCSVHFAPRLRESGVLQDYLDWRDWPAFLPGHITGVQVNGAGVGFSITSAPSSAVYQAVFRPQTPVTRYAFVNRGGSTFSSYAASTLAQQVHSLYASAATTFPDGPPSATDLLALPEAGDLFSGTPMDDAGEFADRVGTGAVEEPAPPEFHEWLTLLAGHPHLLRLLGVVVDIDVNLTGIALPTTLQVFTDYEVPALERRAVHAVINTTPAFLGLADPVAERNELVDGWLKCAAPEVTLQQVDPIGAAVRIGPIGEAGDNDIAETGGLPVRTSGGISLLRDNQAGKVVARITRQVGMEDDIERNFEGQVIPIELWAEDITVGYRFDVFDATSGAWRSVFRRTPTGPYQLPRNGSLAITPPDDESLEVFALTTDGRETSTMAAGFGGFDPELGDFRHPHDKRTGLLRVEPNLFTWQGWSAAVPRPGNMFDSATGEAVPKPPATPDLDSDVQLAIDYEATPASLPRLRFGRTYRMRARAVDLGTWSLPPDPDEVQPTLAATATEFYGRTEPIQAPVVLRRRPRPDPGVHDTRIDIVLKSDYDIPDAIVPPTDRMAFPPKVGQYLCELHGLPNGGIDPTKYDALLLRDNVDLSDLGTRDPDTGELLWATDGPGGPELLPTRPVVGYLPDPAANGITLDGAPGAAGLLSTLWQGAWPDFRAGRLEFRAGGAAAAVRPVNDVIFRVFLPKATDVVATLSCSCDSALIEHFEVFAGLTAAERDALRQQILDGHHWMFGTSVSLHLVHAVRRPLVRPQFTTLTGGRPPVAAALDGIVSGQMIISAASTASLILRGHWIETVDSPSEPAGPQPLQHGVIGSIVIGTVTDTPTINVGFALQSTKRARVFVDSAEAISRFVDYFTEETTFDWTPDVRVLAPAGLVQSSVSIVSAGGTAAVPGVDYTVDAVAGTLTRNPLGQIAPGANVTARFVALPVSRFSTEEVAGAQADAVIPASVEPPPPVVVEVLPAFSVTDRVRPTNVRRSRNGQAIRVWLARPWLASGDFERLAVVLGPEIAGQLRTNFARDPAFTGAAAGVLTTASFPRAALVAGSVDGSTDSVAAHDVTFDVDRQRWSADIEIDEDIGYRPFVRLALARHQADAVPGAHLSPVVWPEPVRLGVNRAVEARKGANGKVTLIVTGTDHDGVPDEVGGLLFNDVVVAVQEADPAVADPDLRWVTTAVATTLTRAAFGRWTGQVTLPASSQPLRLLVTDAEPALRFSGGSVVVDRTVVYVETIDLPAGWVPAP